LFFSGDYAFYGCDSLTAVYFGGTEAQWNAIEISDYNEALLYAEITFNGTAHTHGCTEAVTAPSCVDQGYTSPLRVRRVIIKCVVGVSKQSARARLLWLG